MPTPQPARPITISAWNQEWQAAGYLALAELDCKSGALETALDHLDGHELPFTNTGERVCFTLPAIREHEVVLIEPYALSLGARS